MLKVFALLFPRPFGLEEKVAYRGERSVSRLVEREGCWVLKELDAPIIAAAASVKLSRMIGRDTKKKSVNPDTTV